jgi:DNA (cytosine-5)-methyltransferase 1
LENCMASGTRTLLLGDSEDAIPERPEGDGYTYLPWVDCICAGVPCQDVSVAGKRAGLAGERTGLFYDFARILKGLRPAWFVFENVPGLLSSNNGRDFAEVQRVLMVECGYGIQWRVLDSQFFGVAQERRRLFVVGRFGKPCPAEILFEAADRDGNPEPSRQVRGELIPTLTSSIAKNFSGSGRGSDALGSLVVRIDNYGGNWRNPVREKPQVGGSTYAVLQERSGLEQYAADGMDGAERATNGNDQTAHANGVRSFAGLPEGMDSARYRALGNAVTKTVAEWIARRILTSISESAGQTDFRDTTK